MTHRLLILVAALGLGLGCGDKEDTDTGEESDTDTDTDADTDTDTDADTDITGSGELVYEGSATVNEGGYSGVETATFTDEDGDGEVLCQLEYSINSTATRSDCKTCDWAFDVEVTGVKVLVDNGCAAVGMDSYEGQTRAYGYDPEYFGHAQLLMVDEGNGWGPGDYCSLKGEKFSYYWVYGLISY